MLQSIGGFFARVAREVTPNPFVFAIALTGVIYLLGITLTDSGPFEMVQFWYDGFWDLLGFAMQMVIILVAGYVLATSPPVRRLIGRLADRPKDARQAIILVAVVTIIMGWINWGLGVVTGAVLSMAVCESGRRRGIRIHFPLAAAAGYTAMLIFGAGLSSSAALLVNTQGHFLEEQIGLIPVGQTIFSPSNLILSALFLGIIPFVLAAMHPPASQTIEIGGSEGGAGEGDETRSRGAGPAASAGDGIPGVEAGSGVADPGDPFDGGSGSGVATVADRRTAAAAPAVAPRPRQTFAERLDRSPIFTYVVAAAGLAFAVWYFATRGFDLNIDFVNFLLIMIGLVIYRSPIAYVGAIEEAVRSTGGIVLQFPFYAGIMGMMSASGLVPMFANGLIAVSNEVTFPLASFLSAAIVNIAIPSAGGQWAVQGPILTNAAQTLDLPLGSIVMAFAYGDGLTNMIQPFWALPLLGITALNARDLLGYTAVAMFVAAAIFGIGITVLPLVGL